MINSEPDIEIKKYTINFFVSWGKHRIPHEKSYLRLKALPRSLREWGDKFGVEDTDASCSLLRSASEASFRNKYIKKCSGKFLVNGERKYSFFHWRCKKEKI